MHPAYSVIFFTTASGAGYGLLFLLGIVTFILINIQGAVINQYFKYFVGRENDATIFYTSTTLCLIIGVLLAGPLTRATSA